MVYFNLFLILRKKVFL